VTDGDTDSPGVGQHPARGAETGATPTGTKGIPADGFPLGKVVPGGAEGLAATATEKGMNGEDIIQSWLPDLSFSSTATRRLLSLCGSKLGIG
jgi:hypothetical protein